MVVGAARRTPTCSTAPWDGSVGERGHRPVYLVCTHGGHDACCALRGRPAGAGDAGGRARGRLGVQPPRRRPVRRERRRPAARLLLRAGARRRRRVVRRARAGAGGAAVAARAGRAAAGGPGGAARRARGARPARRRRPAGARRVRALARRAPGSSAGRSPSAGPTATWWSARWRAVRRRTPDRLTCRADAPGALARLARDARADATASSRARGPGRASSGIASSVAVSEPW